jgi:tetratricopeptide (TPR) repeat protein
MIYVHLGLFDKAREESRQALELDPLNLAAQFREGVADLYEGRYQEALTVFEHLPPSFQSTLLTMQTATALFYLGQSNKAKARLEELLTAKANDALLHSVLAILLASGGESRKAQEEILRTAEGKQEDLGHYHHVFYNLASAYALMKDKPAALKSLREAADEGYPCYPRFAKDPNLDNLHGDPPFESFLEEQRQQFERFRKAL